MPSENSSSSNPESPKNESATLMESQRMEMVGRMASSVIHDLNNFLTVIQLNAALLEDVLDDPEDRARMVGEINRACSTAAGLTRNVLSFARRKEAKVEPVHIQKLLIEVVGFLQCLLPRKAKIATDFFEEDLWVKGDRAALTQALMNLLLNALDAGSEEGVKLGLWRGRDEVKITVADFGSGISAEDLPHIFEPFFTTKPGDKGTGLGLPIVHQVLQDHGGRIEVESECGMGTTFRLFLPILTSSEPSIETAPEKAAPAMRKGKAILVVEDDYRIRLVAGQILRRQGYDIYHAGDAEEALQVWAEHADEIALLFTDVVLPGALSGEDLARELREKAENLPVLFTSGKLAVQSQGSHFISKPYPPASLIKKVKSLLD